MSFPMDNRAPSEGVARKMRMTFVLEVEVTAEHRDEIDEEAKAVAKRFAAAFDRAAAGVAAGAVVELAEVDGAA